MDIRDIVNEVRRVSRIKDKTINGDDSNTTKQQTSACTHEPRHREYYRDGLYKCWECKKIIEELPKSTPQQSTEPLDDFKMAVNKLSYVVNNLGINNSFDRTLAKNTIFEINDTFNEYIKSLII